MSQNQPDQTNEHPKRQSGESACKSETVPLEGANLLALRAEPDLQMRVDELVVKCNEGMLTRVEQEEYEGHIRASRAIVILQARARRTLNVPDQFEKAGAQ